MGLRALSFIIAAAFVTGVWSFQSWEGDLSRSDRAASAVSIATADTNADSDSKARDGMASSSSSTKGSAAFISRYPHPDIHHHEEKADHFRSERSVDAVKIAIADTDAKSDSKADHKMASSSSSTKGSAAFVSKHHQDKHRRSARDVKVVVAETDAVSDSKAKDGVALSSSATKGSAAFVSKGNHHEEKEIPHDQPKEGKVEMEVAVKIPEDQEKKPKEKHDDDERENSPMEPFVDLKVVKEKINKLVKDSVDF